MKKNTQVKSTKDRLFLFLIVISLLILGAIMFLSENLNELFFPCYFFIIVLCALNFSRVATLTCVFIAIALNLGKLIMDGDIAGLVAWGIGSLGMFAAALLITRVLELMRKEQHFHNERTAILEVSSTLTKNLNMERLVQEIIEHIFRLFEADGCTLYIISEDKKELIPLGAEEHDQDSAVLDQIRLNRSKVGVGIVGWVAAHGEAILSGDAEADYRSVHIPGTPYDLESVIAVPLISESETFGVLLIYKLCLNAFVQEDLELAKIIANQASIALSNARLYEHVRSLSETDSLTGVWNSRRLGDILSTLVLQTKEKGTNLSMLFIDCDDFKQINDHFGHPVGDLFLRFFAQVLTDGVRDRDVIVRYAGDEFVILLPETSTKEAVAVAERLRSLIGEYRMKDYPELYTTVSMGLATYPVHAQTGELLIRYADDALYKAKNRGKNQFAIYEGDQV